MKTKILLVEDNDGDQKLITEMLDDARIAYNLNVVDSGEKALEEIEDINPGIVLLDTMLPGIDGFKTCESIRKLKIDQPKIIMMTGKLQVYDQEKAQGVGADAYCLKLAEPLVTSILKNLEPDHKG